MMSGTCLPPFKIGMKKCGGKGEVCPQPSKNIYFLFEKHGKLHFTPFS